MIESILRLAIERRLLFLCSILLIVGVGVWSYQKLPIDAVPDITNVQVQINTAAPGYSPLESEQRITYPVETALAGLPNLSYTRSLSRYGLSQVTVVFEEGTDIYFARNLINARLGAIKSVLPPGLEPEMGPISTGLGEIFMYTVQAKPDARMANGELYTSTALREIQDWIIKPQLAQVKGVIEVNSIGGYNKQYHVMPDPTKLLLYKVSVEELVQALQANNDNRGAGYIERNGQQLLVRSPGQLATSEDIGNVIITEHDSVPIKIKDAAQIDIFYAMGGQLAIGALPLWAIAPSPTVAAGLYPDTNYVAILMALAIPGTALPFLLWYWLMAKAPLNQLNIFSFLTPIFGLVLGGVYFAESLSHWQWVGVMIVIVAIVISILPKKRVKERSCPV
jgi:cobalt-zinc-cadmium resistance protein CzcA